MLGYLSFESSLGWLVVAESSEGIALVDFLGPKRPSEEVIVSSILREYPKAAPEPRDDAGLRGEAKAAILRYLEERKPLPGIRLDLRKGTVFDQSVWKAIAAIPFGETRSYTQIAAAAGSPGAVRAAGRACGRNHVPLFIPCHRVVASGGKLGGFSGGLDIKRALLDLESAGR